MRVIGIDPGPVYTAWAQVDSSPPAPVRGGILSNLEMLLQLNRFNQVPGDTYYAIEMIASYGMPVGRSVFDTCVWIGRFFQNNSLEGQPVSLVYRREVKMYLCGNMRAKDSNIAAAICDQYGGDRSTAVGVKAAPGPLYGFKKDMWAALGVALTYRNKMDRESKGAD